MKKLSFSFLLMTAVLIGLSLPGKASPKTAHLGFSGTPSSGVFTSFNAHREGKAATGLMWRVSANAAVLHFEIEKSYDGEFFDPACDQMCTNASRYDWKDATVYPGFIYYRIAAHMINGDVVYSDVQVVHIVQH